ncbi:MAG: T9SS C-terminal target domain-containing protein [Balneolaceae bacterium]|nr:MAG: T9SS C-terminal target domain-containing protein [Balneolaceae bacterium]
MFGLREGTYMTVALAAFLQIIGIAPELQASKLAEIKVLDQDYLILHFKDGEVFFVDDGTGPSAFAGHESDPDNSYVVTYGEPLNVSAVQVTDNWTITSGDDDNYGSPGVVPTAVFRKSRVNGMSYTGWDHIKSDHGFDYTKEHFVYLEMPSSMQQGKTYTVEIDEVIRSETVSQTITFDIFSNVSEAVHVNLVGYMSSSRIKAADLYHFMGDGGNRDYSAFEGNDVYIYNVDSADSIRVGQVSFWMQNEVETYWNLTGSDVWSADFTGFHQPGTYRLAVEGVGSSRDFEIRDDIYRAPYKVSILGYYYMRIGEDRMDMVPVPRRPLWIQDVDPPNCKIYVTEMHPFHPEWGTFSRGDAWDRPTDWARFVKEGNPTNPNAVGGHSDALDWDRHLGHVVNIYDLLLAYILSDGALDDDNLRIGESGNGIPDILDEARNEVDFWLNLRYRGGYAHGLTNPDGNNRLYQAGNTAIAAWANALNSAMMSYSFLIAGKSDLSAAYKDSAIVAYDYAGALPDPMLDDKVQGIRGRDFKMMAAAYLYNVTGDTHYEDVVNSESVATSRHASIHHRESHNQLWGTAAYLLTKRPVHYPVLFENMRSAIIAEAKASEANNVYERPSRRGYAIEQAWWQTNQDMHRTIVAHAVTDNPTEKMAFLDALLLEADWGLGRNPLNKIQMTTATTELADKRSIENCYTSGRNDGTPGLHPGHTPYLNTESWGGHMVGNNPRPVFRMFYPGIDAWPHAEKYINTRYIWSHSEFTPRQTMRGKALLYGYLYSLSKNGGNAAPSFVADAGPNQRIVDQEEAGKVTVTLDGSRSYSRDSKIVSYKWFLDDDEIATGRTASVELEHGTYEVTLVVENADGMTARDTIMIEILASSFGEAEYDFENPDQLHDWSVSNWGEGGAPATSLSAEIAHRGSHSMKISGNFISGSEIALRREGNVPGDVVSVMYHVWIPQVFLDSVMVIIGNDGQVGGIQNYVMHSNWQWESKWFRFEEISGDHWNLLEFEIPESVHNSSVQAIGISFKMLDVNVGEENVFVDDILFARTATSSDFADSKGIQSPKDFILYNNYPNPFNSQTRIQFALPRMVNITLSVFDILGRRVLTLIDSETYSAGYHTAVWDAQDYMGRTVATGVYIYLLQAEEYVKAKSMLFLK